MGMTVRVKEHPTGLRQAMGYYAHQRRYPGDQFELEHDSHFSNRWMEKVSGSGAVTVGINLKEKK